MKVEFSLPPISTALGYSIRYSLHSDLRVLQMYTKDIVLRFESFRLTLFFFHHSFSETAALPVAQVKSAERAWLGALNFSTNFHRVRIFCPLPPAPPYFSGKNVLSCGSKSPRETIQSKQPAMNLSKNKRGTRRCAPLCIRCFFSAHYLHAFHRHQNIG